MSLKAVADVLAAAITLRSKPYPDIKVNGQVRMWMFESTDWNAKAKAGTTTLVLDGSILSAHETLTTMYLSHCSGMLPVIAVKPKRASGNAPKFQPVDSKCDVKEFYFKIANCRIVSKSSIPFLQPSILPHANVVVQVSSKLARDQWISKLYLAKKSSVTAPPLLLLSRAQEFSSLHNRSREAGSQQLKTRTAESKTMPASRALCVILPLSNPIGFRRREELFQQTLRRMLAVADVNASLCVVSIRLDYKSTPKIGIRRELSAERQSERYAQLHVETALDDVLWAKENLINIAIRWVCEQRFGEGVEVLAVCCT
jgi:hypothetical protein